MQLTPTERDRLLIFTAAELARARRARGLRLNAPEATALVSDTVCEAARDGLRLAEAVARARPVLSPADVLPAVPDLVTEIHVEAVFEDGTRLAVVADPFGRGGLGPAAPGAVLLDDRVDPTSRTPGVPFGAGGHLCIGESFARAEMMTVVATVAGRWRLAPVPGARVRGVMTSTNRPDGLLMTVEPRTPARR
ncbi:urease subunit gamma [Kitasatospora purpeofusca]|uniref:urease subunit gamma n=1 Tax=Kitasatospora purpeofusca TaxID=67352 RepID=UPI0036D3DCC9